MLRLRYLKPGAYRIICIKDYWKSISNFVIYPLINGQINYSAYAEHINIDYDTDLDYSSIDTGPEFLGDHSCTQHRVKSYGFVNFTTPDGESGYTRIHYDTSDAHKRDQIHSFSSGKNIIDYLPREYKTESFNQVTYYKATRSEMSSHFEQLIIRSNGTSMLQVNDMSLTWESGKIRRYCTQTISETGKPDRVSTNSQLLSVSGSSTRHLDIIVSDVLPNYTAYIHNWDNMLKHCMDNAAPAPVSDVFGAALEAARGFNAYDINMIEAIAGFGLDDLYPRKLSRTLYRELQEFISSPSLLTALTKAAYLASTTYLYLKYVVANNVADVEQLLGLSGSSRFATAEELAEKIANSVSTEEVSDWNFRLAKMAQKIVYKWDYLQDTYGGITQSTSNGFDTATRVNTAHLQATPGPLRDMSASAIICDDIGLSLRASRVAQAVKLEFLANWFFPIEENLDRLEFNQAHLNQLYRVRRLCQSDKVTHKFNFENLKYLYGLSDVESGYLTVTDYHRWTTDEFPPTTFRFGPNGGPTLSRVLQGSALIITSLH